MLRMDFDDEEIGRRGIEKSPMTLNASATSGEHSER